MNKMAPSPIYGKNPSNIFSGEYQCLRSAAPKLALMPASCSNCDVKLSNLNVCAKFH